VDITNQLCHDSFLQITVDAYEAKQSPCRYIDTLLFERAPMPEAPSIFSQKPLVDGTFFLENVSNISQTFSATSPPADDWQLVRLCPSGQGPTPTRAKQRDLWAAEHLIGGSYFYIFFFGKDRGGGISFFHCYFQISVPRSTCLAQPPMSCQWNSNKAPGILWYRESYPTPKPYRTSNVYIPARRSAPVEEVKVTINSREDLCMII
jgi:hypothetical protein